MQSSRASTRRAALAAFLLFAAGLLVVRPAEASRTTTETRSSLATTSATPLAPSSSLELSSPTALELVEPIDPVESSPRFGFADDLAPLDPKAGPGGFVVFAAEAAQCELTYARNNPLKYVDPDGKEIQYSAAYVSRIRSDSAFAAAHRAWRFSPSGSEQHRRMGGDPNTRYVLTVGPVTYFGSSGTNFGVTYPVPEWAKTNKAGKLDAPKVEMTIDVDARRATDPQPPGTSTAAELAKTIFHESSHGLDTGSGTRTAAETRQRETALTNESDPAMVKFKLELKTTLPSDEKELKK